MDPKTSLVTALVLLLAGGDGGAAHGGYLYTRPAISFDLPQQPLTVLAEAPFSIDQQLIPVPLLTIPKDRIRVMQEGTKHQVELPDKGMMPAVRVVLRRPMMVPASAGASAAYRIPFPATFTVLHGGLRVPLRVGSLLAPVPSGPLALRIPVQVLYAVPVQPFALRPYFPSLGYYPQRRPVLAPPTVTVLDFPEAVATPGSLLYQPPLEDEDVGNREPPQAIVPAGIVQSTAPQPNLSVFINSKESPLLQVLRDEAANNSATEDEGRIDDDDAIVVLTN